MISSPLSSLDDVHSIFAPFPDAGHRFLFAASRHNIFYLLYLCVLVICCFAPCTYYVRLFLWQRQRLRRLEELERAGLVAALQRTLAAANNNSNSNDPLETAIREERRARILQLLEPVQQKLQESDFRETLESTAENEGAIEVTGHHPHSSDESPSTPKQRNTDEETGKRLLFAAPASIEKKLDDDTASVDDDDEKLQICVPADNGGGVRWVPGQCTICLCRYRPGVVVARASHPACPHVFHAACIETWLLRHEDPVCPCCRRDFLLDPYDIVMGDDDGDIVKEDDRTIQYGDVIGEDHEDSEVVDVEQGVAITTPEDSSSSHITGPPTEPSSSPNNMLQDELSPTQGSI